MFQAEITGRNTPLKVRQVAIPEAPAAGLLVKTAYAGICRSDLGFINDWVDIGAGKRYYHSQELADQGEKFEGIVPGHEISGQIVAFGTDASPEQYGLSKGDRVAVYPWVGCQVCDMCQAGCNNMCEDDKGGTTDFGQGRNHGGYAEYICIPSCQFVVKVPESIPLDVACMLPCSGSTAYNAISRARPCVDFAVNKRGEARVMILGTGGVGLWAVSLMKVLFCSDKVKVIAADVDQSKLDLALATGADDAILMNNEEDKMRCDKVDAVLDFVGSERTVALALGALRKGGTLVLIGLAGGQLAWPLPGLISCLISVQGVRTSTLDDLKEVINIVSRSEVKRPHLEYFQLSKVNEALDRLRRGEMNGRGIIQY